MLWQRRLGKVLKLPPTVQIVRELRLFCAQEDARIRHARANLLPDSATWDLISQTISLRTGCENPLARNAADADV